MEFVMCFLGLNGIVKTYSVKLWLIINNKEITNGFDTLVICYVKM